MDQNNASPKKMNVGLIGAGFMAKAHSIAYAGMPMFFWPAPIIPVKKMIVDMNEAIAREAKDKFAFESYSTDWHDVVNNPEIDVVDICTPNNVHAEIAIAAAKAGKHIICEKPLALTVDQAREMYLTAKENNIKTLVGGVVTGKIVGGNLSLISDLHGTPYEIDFDSKIILIEEVEEEPYNIDRMFAQLRLSKNIYKAKGFIFGYFTDCKDPLNEQSYEALIKEYFGSLNVPIIYDFPTGHEFPLLNVPIGLEVKLDADNKTITIMEELYEKD